MTITPPDETPGAAEHPRPAELLDAAVAAAHQAAEYLRSLDRDGVAREYKQGSHDIVTEHDRACEELIVAELRRRVPGAGILGEEGGERPAAGEADGGRTGEAGRSDAEVRFLVDPIDGTSNFAAGLPLFCVSIGVSVGEELVAGVIDAPILRQVFTAADGPAMLNGRRITPRRTTTPRDALVLTGYPTYRDVEEDRELAAHWGARIHEEHSAVRHLGSAALELAYVAAGWSDAAMLASINPWDVAAGFHLVRRAGGSLRTWPGTGAAVAPDHERPAYVACTGPERLPVLDELQDALQARREERGAGA